jgi:DSF synthase
MSYLSHQPSYRSDFRQNNVADHAEYPSVVGTAGRVEIGAMSTFLPVLRELTLSLDADRRTLWQFMAPCGRPSFTSGLLRDMTMALDFVERAFADTVASAKPMLEFLVLASHMPGIFNLGGDLPHFIELIERADRDRLAWYARVCAQGQYRRAVNLDLPICTIALVQGDALGGGFEAALAHDFIIAERRASFGLPEVLFNMFPGMGAYSFLARRLDVVRAERMILSGKVYSAEELHSLGVVDVLVDDGAGVDAVHDFIADFSRAGPARRALLKARRIVNPITLGEMIEIADLWVEAALRLGPADLRKMRHLAKAQDRRSSRRPQSA